MAAPSVGVVDVGTGNLFSVLRGLERAGANPVLLDRPESLRTVSRLVFPGVGSFADAARRLDETGFRDALVERANAGVPLLGICLGMQLLFDAGDEDGGGRGLGLLSGRVVRLPNAPGLSVPHVGWQRVTRTETKGFADGSVSPWLYFSHSFYAVPADPSVVVAHVTHGVQVPALVKRANVFGIQPHPEKSGRDGEALLRWFASAEVSS